MKITRDTAIFYPSATCNLHCRYCNIDKNKYLYEIDKDLEESFKGDYYFEKVKKYFPRKDTLQCIETWGGEPFLHMERIYPLIDQLINYYPYFSRFFSSTNFSYDAWTDKFFGLMDCFGKYPYRTFHVTLQLSLDGPEYINDAGRGEGVTQRCLNVYKKFLDLLSQHRLADNVELRVVYKGTLDMASVQSLMNEQAIIDYFKFIEDNFIEPLLNLKLENIITECSVPNTAVPSPVTKEDGCLFTKFIMLCRKIEKDNAINKIFKYYSIITPYSKDTEQLPLTYHSGFNTCGAGFSSIGFLPKNMLSTCHEGFVQLAEQYQVLAAQASKEESTITFDNYLDEQTVHTCVTEEEYETFEFRMSLFNTEGQTTRLVASTAMIIALALAGEIEPRYIDEGIALRASLFIQSHTAFCFKDNYNKTGSYLLQPVGTFKLLLNGAMQYIYPEGEINYAIEGR